MNLMILSTMLAQANSPQSAPQVNPKAELLKTVGLFIVMAIGMYFVLIRPQQKKAKDHATLLKTLRSGDKIVTNGGVVGVVVTVKDKTVSIRSADTKMEVLKSAVAEITERSGESSEA